MVLHTILLGLQLLNASNRSEASLIVAAFLGSEVPGRALGLDDSPISFFPVSNPEGSVAVGKV